MARIVLIDETSATERFSTDTSKNANIGSGAGSGRITAAGSIFANASALLASGRSVALSVRPTHGAVSVWTFGSGNNPWVTVTTSEPGQVPVACCDGVTVNQAQDPLGFGCTAGRFPRFQCDAPAAGQFNVNNNDLAFCVGSIQESTTYYYI